MSQTPSSLAAAESILTVWLSEAATSYGFPEVYEIVSAYSGNFKYPYRELKHSCAWE